MFFSTKAQTLENIASIIKSAKVLPQIRCTVEEWRNDTKKVLKEIIKANWIKKHLIIRSSALAEDNSKESKAGEFSSVLGVKGEKQIVEAVEKVIGSFHLKNEKNDLNQIFIQPEIKDVLLSGVAFSKNPTTRASYIIINYDDATGTTDTVTSGRTNELKTFHYYKHSNIKIKFPLNRVINLIYELEEIFKIDEIDIEFCITNDRKLYLLQIRPLVFPEKKNKSNDLNLPLKNIYNKLCSLNANHPYLHGTKAVYGVMPDWNPAEIIGIKPKPLALSLYKELITDNIWAYQRNNYGYKNLRSFPLLIDFFGLPYIDVRVSFNSFLPKGLDKTLSDKLVNYYTKRLVQSPKDHDKVEFKILFSCYTLDLPKRLDKLKDYGFSKNEISELTQKLRVLTNEIIDRRNGIWKNDLERIGELSKRFEAISKSQLDIVSKIYWIIEDCKRYGTLPFAGLARAGFIAVQFLQSLVNEKIFTIDEYNSFFKSLNTISTQMNVDFNNLSKDKFLVKYGHLRPGTYDLLSPSYKETPDLYFDWNKQKNIKKSDTHKFVLSFEQMKKIEALLIEHGLNHNIISFFDFIKSAIEGREYAKFIFTKSLSHILTLFKEFGKSYVFNEEDCSYANIEIIKKLYDSSSDHSVILKNSIEYGKSLYEYTKQISLPPLIINPEDVYAFHMPSSDPNFITLLKTKGNVVSLNEENQNLKKSILFIESADPGYDWIFSHNIKGFVTKYGGANSHMAIRAAELDIPAIIGAGENLFNKWSEVELLEIDCANRKVVIIK